MIDHARPPLAVREQSPELARQVERPPSPWRTAAIVAREIAPPFGMHTPGGLAREVSP